MDPGSVLDHYSNDFNNLPAEVRYLLKQISLKDAKYYETQKKIVQHESQIQKFIKENGSLTTNSKEDQLNAKIKKLYKECEIIQDDKVTLANTVLYIVSKGLAYLGSDIKKLMREGLLHDEFDSQTTATTASYLTNGAATPLSALNTNVFDFFNETYISATPSPLVASYVDKAGISSSHRRSPSVSSSNKRKQIVSRQPSATGFVSSASNNAPKRQKLTSSLSQLDTNNVPKNNSLLGVAASAGAHRALKTPMTPSNLSHSVTSSNVPSNSATTNPTAGASNGGSLLNASDLAVAVSSSAPKIENGEDQTPYCFCRQVSFGAMVGCDNPKCKYEWFHYKCVGLEAEPIGKWYCPDCTKRMEKKKRKKLISIGA